LIFGKFLGAKTKIINDLNVFQILHVEMYLHFLTQFFDIFMHFSQPDAKG